VIALADSAQCEFQMTAMSGQDIPKETESALPMLEEYLFTASQFGYKYRHATSQFGYRGVAPMARSGNTYVFISDTMPKNARTNLWQRHVLNPAAPPGVDALTETVRSVYNTLAAYGPAGLSLADLTFDTVQGEHLAALLRATFRLRTQISGWRHALFVAEAALRREGVDPNDALVGLHK
jgi:hypothetical protein